MQCQAHLLLSNIAPSRSRISRQRQGAIIDMIDFQGPGASSNIDCEQRHACSDHHRLTREAQHTTHETKILHFTGQRFQERLKCMNENMLLARRTPERWLWTMSFQPMLATSLPDGAQISMRKCITCRTARKVHAGLTAGIQLGAHRLKVAD